jgi:hypothetical protein
MGLDMRPMGKPKPGFEKRYIEIYQMLKTDTLPKPSMLEKLLGKKGPTKEELIEEWFANLIPTYETIKAPRVGRDKEADAWVKEQYEESDKKVSLQDFVKEYQGYYVIDLAKEADGVPVYRAFGQDENVFRGQFLNDCVDLIGKELVHEAWETKLADDALDYGNRLMQAADKIAVEKNLQHLKGQRMPPEDDEKTIESKLHIVYSLARWLIFYGKNGHGYEADF